MRRLANYGVFYLTWFGMILGETYLWAIAGFLLGFIVFVAAGTGLAYFHHHYTKGGEKPFGWPLRFGKWATARFPYFGLLLNGFLNGAPGVGLVETALGYPWNKTRTRVIIAAIGYAALWCTIHALRPPGPIPIYWHPSLQALLRVWDLVR